MTTACRGSVYQKGDLEYPCSVVWNCLNARQLLIAAFVWSAGRVCFFPPHKNPIDTG
jgi:hypothetical protein